MNVLGIDPGLTGAMALVDREEMQLRAMRDIPTCAKTNGKGRQVDPRTLCAVVNDLLDYFRLDYVVLERSQPMRKQGRTQGVTSTFSMGHTFGMLEYAVMQLSVPVVFPLAAHWKRAAGLTGKPKEASLTLARQLFPAAQEEFLSRAGDHNRAEAMLMAVYTDLGGS